MGKIEYIDSYFNEELSAGEKTAFERKITADLVFAQEVAFYLSAKKAVNQELIEEKQRFREIYTGLKERKSLKDERPATVRKLWPLVAAAAILIGIIFGWYTWFSPVGPTELANKYIAEHFKILPVAMSAKDGSMATAGRLYNEGRIDEALKQFEDIVNRDTSNIEAIKYAGIASLQAGQYDKAIDYFSKLEKHTRLYANPGKFYHALALMKRNRPGDSETARQILQQVIKNNLEEKEVAEKWLEKW